MFYNTNIKEVCYLDTPVGLVKCELTEEKIIDAGSTYKHWNEVFVLRNKLNLKELDPKYFDEKEWKAFREADKAEWDSWIKNKVVNVLTPDQEKKVPRDQIFTAPMRFVRTNKAKDPEKLEAKSRLIIPGHLDPLLHLQLGCA